jgi:hypothetical protein
VQNANELDSIWKRAIENYVVASGQTAKVWGEIGSFPSEFRHPRKQLAFFINEIKPAVGGRRVFFSDAKRTPRQDRDAPDWSAGQSASVAFVAQTAADFILDGLHIQGSHVSAIGLLDSNGGLAAQFLVAESPHVLGFAQPAI